MSVHPMREDAVLEFLKKARSHPDTFKRLVKNGRLVETQYKGRIFYIRNFPES
jgi:hypothetical protein